MILCHNIGERYNSNYNTREEIIACKDPISFDGVYLNVWENRDILKGKDITLYVIGSVLGKDNSFDTGQRPEKYCDWTHILDLMVNYGCKLGYHSHTHRDLTKIPEIELYSEIKPPYPVESFAYPYGYFNEKVIEIVKLCGYTEAYSVFQGDGSQYQKNRSFLNW